MGKKIHIFSDIYYPEDMAIAIRMRHLVDALVSTNHFEVTIHTCSDTKSYPNVRIKRNIFPAPNNTSSNVFRLLNEIILGIEVFVKILFIRSDLNFFTSPPFFVSYLGILASRLRRKPYILDVRDYYPEVFFVSNLVKRTGVFGRLLQKMESGMYKHSQLVSLATQGLLDHAIDGNPGDNYVLFRNGYDSKLFQPQDEKNDIFTLIFHGNLGKFQAVDLIVKLAQRCYKEKHNIQFKVIGWGSNDEILKTDNTPNLEYLGRVQHRNIGEIIAKAHIGLSLRSEDFISRTAFPVKVYEYIGARLPIIITPKSEAGEFVEKTKIGFQFDTDDFDSLYLKIIELYENRTLLEELTNNCDLLKNEFSRELLSKKFVDSLIKKTQL